MGEEAALDGLLGIAMQGSASGSAKEVAALIQAKIDPGRLSMDQKINFLWSSCALGLTDGAAFRTVHEELQGLQFERITNDLSYSQAEKVRDYLTYLRRLSAV